MAVQLSGRTVILLRKVVLRDGHVNRVASGDEAVSDDRAGKIEIRGHFLRKGGDKSNKRELKSMLKVT